MVKEHAGGGTDRHIWWAYKSIGFDLELDGFISLGQTLKTWK